MSGASGPISPNLGSKFGEGAGWYASMRVSQKGFIMRYMACVSQQVLLETSVKLSVLIILLSAHPPYMLLNL